MKFDYLSDDSQKSLAPFFSGKMLSIIFNSVWILALILNVLLIGSIVVLPLLIISLVILLRKDTRAYFGIGKGTQE